MEEKPIVYICDWLPPDFGAVGQYSLIFAREWAQKKGPVVLVGLTSQKFRTVTEEHPAGVLKIIYVHRTTGVKSILWKRLLWTFISNFLLIKAAFPDIKESSQVKFTGSPPFMLFFAVPLKWLMKKRIVYRITDFYPEVIIAAHGGKSALLFRIGLAVTIFLRHRVDQFEIIGFDQKQRLLAQGIPESRLAIIRDRSPVEFVDSRGPLERPVNTEHNILLLYSGNFGVAHEAETFMEAYRCHHRQGNGRVIFWLNAVGAQVQHLCDFFAEHKLPFVKGEPVPLEQLDRLLLTADAHLVTLKDAFVGYVLPSKIYACIESKKPILFIGSRESDIDLLCQESLPASRYMRIDVGDVKRLTEILNSFPC